jgi:methyl-accepting chemotaxis protein
LSFYFGIVSTRSALASRVPELADVVDKLKTMLLSSTLIFVGIIIGSFYILSLLLTERMFKPLEDLREDLAKIADGHLPRERIDRHGGPFISLEEAYNSARIKLEDRERTEIAELAECIKMTGSADGSTEKLEKLVNEKKRFCGEAGRSNEKETKAQDKIFMQPV